MLKTTPKFVRSQRHRPETESGFTLAIMTVIGLIIVASSMAIITRTFSGLMGSIRQGQSQQAQEAAETGMAMILKELNENYPYLLISSCDIGRSYETTDCKGWKFGSDPNNLKLESSICNSAAQDPSAMLNKIRGSLANGRGSYQLISYQFTGNEQQGGEGTIRIKGEANVSSERRATSVVEQTVSILPKPCDKPVDTPSGESSFAGLLATESINLGNNDITGSFNANIYCFPNTVTQKCMPGPYKSDDSFRGDIGANASDSITQISGTIYAAKVAIPTVPAFPDGIARTPMPITSNTDIVAGENTSSCYFESTTGITHCNVGYINLNGGEQIRLWTKPGTGPSSTNLVPSTATKGIHLYFPYTDSLTAAKQIINMTGGSSLIQAGYASTEKPNPTNLALFGLPQPAIIPPATSLPPPSQTITLGGGSTLNGFIYFPDGKFSINGSTSCSGKGKCAADGSTIDEVNGAVWTRQYQGSNGNKININVPDDMGRLLYDKFGIEYAIGIREYAAMGTSRWQLFQLP